MRSQSVTCKPAFALGVITGIGIGVIAVEPLIVKTNDPKGNNLSFQRCRLPRGYDLAQRYSLSTKHRNSPHFRSTHIRPLAFTVTSSVLPASFLLRNSSNQSSVNICVLFSLLGTDE